MSQSKKLTIFYSYKNNQVLILLTVWGLNLRTKLFYDGQRFKGITGTATPSIFQ